MSFSERFPEKCSTFHLNAGHYKAEFECSFHSRKYWSLMRLDGKQGVPSAECEVWKMWSVWKMRSMENEECVENVENADGKCG